jgi:hypothetical protein
MLTFMYVYWAYWHKTQADPNHLMPGMWYLSAYQMLYGAIFAWITVNVIIVWVAMGFFRFDAWFVMFNFMFSLISATLCTIYVKYWRKKLIA